jgi:hypothetical protein
MDTALAILLGIGLAASCGFRVFVPLLVAGIATSAGYLDVAAGFEWLGSTPALIGLAVAAVVEIGAFYIPWIDKALDAVATPAAVVAGAVVFAAVAVDLDPFVKWTLAVIAGGGSAAAVQGGTVLARLASTATTGGLANFAVNTIETIAGFVFSLLAIILPILTVVILATLIATMYYVGRRTLRRRSLPAPAGSPFGRSGRGRDNRA